MAARSHCGGASQVFKIAAFPTGFDRAALTVMNDLLAGSVAMSVVDVVAIVDAIADALDFAHQRGLLHRDVKPANIFMTAGASQRRILLADFGIGREIAHTGGLTATNMTVGTVSYAAPEQFGTPPWVQRGRRVPLRLQHDRLVEVSHASRVQPAARDLVQIRRRPSVLPRRSDGLVHHEVGGDVEFALEAVALLYEFDRTPCAGRASAVLIAMTRFSMMCARSGPMSERRCSRSAADRRRCFCLAIRLSRLRLPMPGVWRTGPTCR